jgi:hypothetical protein
MALESVLIISVLPLNLEVVANLYKSAWMHAARYEQAVSRSACFEAAQNLGSSIGPE